MKIIFLDIDGVMNSQTYYRSIKVKSKDWDRFDPIAVKLLKMLLEEFEAKIVITSSWRFGAIDILINELSKTGLKKYLYKDWKTPQLYGYKRGDEIQKWLEKHLEVNNYIIIDDEENILDNQLRYFIKTNMTFGFNDECYERAKIILSE